MLKCADSLKFMHYESETAASLREVFLRHRTYHTTSWCHRVALACPSGILLAYNSHLRVAFVWNIGDTRCLHDGYTRASRSRVAFLTQLVNFVCPSCFPQCMVRGSSCSLPQPSQSLRLKMILLPSSGVTSREIRKIIFVCPSRVKIGTVWRQH